MSRYSVSNAGIMSAGGRWTIQFPSAISRYLVSNSLNAAAEVMRRYGFPSAISRYLVSDHVTIGCVTFDSMQAVTWPDQAIATAAVTGHTVVGDNGELGKVVRIIK